MKVPLWAVAVVVWGVVWAFAWLLVKASRKSPKPLLPIHRIERTEMVTRTWVMDGRSEAEAEANALLQEPADVNYFGPHEVKRTLVHGARGEK